MAITFRDSKGSPLTHDELDQNFREFYFSASYIGEEERPYGLNLFTSAALNQPSTFYFPTAVGDDYFIQIKSGSTNTSSSFLTGSSNFKYNYRTDHLSVSGSANFSQSVDIGGDLTVVGKVTAREVITTISSSQILVSGSTRFGDTADDTHIFTGSVKVSNGITGSLLATNGILSSSAQIADNISGSSNALSQSLQHRVDALEDNSLSIGDLNNSSSVLRAEDAALSSSIAILSSSHEALSESVSSSYLRNTTDTLTGDLTVTGTLTANTYVVSSSVTHLTTSFSSGSTKFGDSADDTHTFTGSVNITGSLDVDTINATTINATITGSIDNAVTASYVNSSSIHGTVESATSASFITFNGGLTTTSDVRFDSLGVGTDASGTTGEIRATGDITAYYSSDERLKDNITPLSDAINKINQIGGYEFDWNSNSSHSGHDVGVIAQEIQKVLPEVVTQRDNGYLAVRYEKIVALLIQAIKDQQLQIDELKSKL